MAHHAKWNWNIKNYFSILEFSTRLLPPSEKARATEGKILDGTLITWPRYIKRHEQFEKDGAQPAFLGRHGFKMAWGGVSKERLKDEEKCLVGWLVGWLCGWLASCLVHWLAIKLVGWSVSWLVSWLAGWLISCMLAGCWLLHDSFVAWLVSWLDGCLCRWINK